MKLIYCKFRDAPAIKFFMALLSYRSEETITSFLESGPRTPDAWKWNWTVNDNGSGRSRDAMVAIIQPDQVESVIASYGLRRDQIFLIASDPEPARPLVPYGSVRLLFGAEPAAYLRNTDRFTEAQERQAIAQLVASFFPETGEEAGGEAISRTVYFRDAGKGPEIVVTN